MSEEKQQIILLFGGSFDPPTRAHFDLAESARKQVVRANPNLPVDVLFIPAARSPHKPNQPTAPGAARLAMLRAATEGNPHAHITPLELTRAETEPDSPSYTVDTLRTLVHHYASAQLHLLIGADQAISFHRWREPREIIKLAPPVVMLRPPTTKDELLDSMRDHWSELELLGDPVSGAPGWSGGVVEVPQSDASSTEARARLAAGSLDKDLLPILPEPVLKIIRNQHLYTP